MTDTRFDPSASLPRVARRAVLAAALAGPVAGLLCWLWFPGGVSMGEGAWWATFAFTVPWLVGLAGRVRPVHALALLAVHALFLAPVLCGPVATAAKVRLGGGQAVDAWLKATEELRRLVVGPLGAHIQLTSLWMSGRPPPLFLLLLLDSPLVPRLPWPARVLVVALAAAAGVVLFTAWSQEWTLRAWPPAEFLLQPIACTAGVALCLAAANGADERLALWLTARQDEAARRG